jgi:hypothetical protein
MRWDPLGIRDRPDAQSEYDSYVGPTLSLLAKRGCLEDFEEFLAQIEIDQMGRSDSEAAAAKRHEVAVELYDWFANLPRA